MCAWFFWHILGRARKESRSWRKRNEIKPTTHKSCEIRPQHIFFHIFPGCLKSTLFFRSSSQSLSDSTTVLSEKFAAKNFWFFFMQNSGILRKVFGASTSLWKMSIRHAFLSRPIVLLLAFSLSCNEPSIKCHKSHTKSRIYCLGVGELRESTKSSWENVWNFTSARERAEKNAKTRRSTLHSIFCVHSTNAKCQSSLTRWKIYPLRHCVQSHNSTSFICLHDMICWEAHNSIEFLTITSVVLLFHRKL